MRTRKEIEDDRINKPVKVKSDKCGNCGRIGHLTEECDWGSED
jgi:hypothetical protein